MLEHTEFAQVQAAWLDQPEEEVPVDMEQVYGRRTSLLYSTTRSEVLGSVGAALFFAVVMAWRFAPERDRLVQYGCAAVAVWAAVTVYRFRSSLRRHMRQPAVFASTGLDHYRRELLHRRDHLRSVWIWHGPLWLAGLLAAAIVARRMIPERLWDAAPAIVLLAVWAVIGVRRRFRQAAEIQHEIDDL